MLTNLCEPAGPDPYGEGQKSFSGKATGDTKVDIITYHSDDGKMKVDTITVGDHRVFAGSRNQVQLDEGDPFINPEVAAKVRVAVQHAEMCNFDPAAKLLNDMVKFASSGRSPKL